jgi:hypothetical protein
MEQSDQIQVSAISVSWKRNLYPLSHRIGALWMNLRLWIFTIFGLVMRIKIPTPVGTESQHWVYSLALKWLRYHCSFITLSPLYVTEKYSASNVSANIYKMLELECEDNILSFSNKIKIYYIPSPLTLSHILINILHIFIFLSLNVRCSTQCWTLCMFWI